MANSIWLSEDKIKTFAAELLTKEFSSRVSQRLEYLYKKYSKNNGLVMFDIMEMTLNNYQNQIDSLIQHNQYDILKEYGLSYEDEINEIRAVYPFMRYLLYGLRIRNTTGNITWNEIDQIKQEINLFKQEKEIFEFGKQTVTDNFGGREVSIESDKKYNETLSPTNFQDLFREPSEIETYVEILKKVSRDKNKPLIDDNNGWITGKGKYSILIAWINTLEEKGKFRISINNQKKSELLNKYFSGLNLKTDDTSLWNKLTPTWEDYRAEFKKLIK